MISKEVRIRELTLLAEKLKVEHYSEYEMIREMIEVRKVLVVFQMFIWFKNYRARFFFCFCFFFSLVSDYGNESETKEKKNLAGLEFLNHRKN